MHAILEDHRSEVEELCREYRVRRLDVFGSAVRGNFRLDQSDLDFLVEFHPPAQGDSWKRYFDLLHGLEDLFGRHIDLVEDSAIKNPYFRESVDETRELFYG